MSTDKLFPIMGGPAIPWVLIAPHERQALSNHSQTLQRLAARGGLSPCEAVAVLEDREWLQMNQDEAKRRLQAFVDASLEVKLAAANARIAELEALVLHESPPAPPRESLLRDAVALDAALAPLSMPAASPTERLREQIGRVKAALLREDSQRAETLFHAASGLCIAAAAVLKHLPESARGEAPLPAAPPAQKWRCKECSFVLTVNVGAEFFDCPECGEGNFELAAPVASPATSGDSNGSS